MSSSDLLLRKSFWYYFIGFIVLGLFFYGLSIEKGKTELQQTKLELAEKNATIKTLNEEVNVKVKKISELNSKVSKLEETLSTREILLSEKEESINQLGEEIRILKNRPPETITKYQDRIVYKEKSEPYHPYGKGYGKLVIYTTCSNVGRLTVQIDGESAGSLNKCQTGAINCDISEAIKNYVLAGKHRITGKDKKNRTWDGYVTVIEDECQTYGLTCK